MLGQRDSCPANVAFHRKFCLTRVVSNNAVHNQFVLHVGDLGIGKVSQLREGATVMLRGVPNALDKFFEHSVIRSRVGQQVKLSIKPQEALNVGCLFNLARQVDQLFNLGAREVWNAVCNQQRFKPLADQIRFITLAFGQPRHPCTGICLERDKSIALEKAKSISNRLSTGSKSLGNFFLNNPFARCESSVENFFPQRCGYCAGRAGCHNVTFASFSYALPFG